MSHNVSSDVWMTCSALYFLSDSCEQEMSGGFVNLGLEDGEVKGQVAVTQVFSLNS